MIELLSNNIFSSSKIQLTFWVEILSIIIFFVGYIFPEIIQFLLSRFVSSEAGEKTEKLLQPDKYLIGIAFALGFLEIVALIIPVFDDYPAIEIIISLILTIACSILITKIFGNYVDESILDSALKSGRQANSELFFLVKFLVYFYLLKLTK